MRIAALIPEDEGLVNPIYRVLLPMAALEQRGHRVALVAGDEPQRGWDPSSFDLVWFWRQYGGRWQALARELRAAAVPIVWDNDDDISSIPRGDATYKRAGGGLALRRVQGDIATMMRLASLVTCPSGELVRRYEALSDGTPVRLLENCLPDDFAAGKRERTDDGVVTIGWVASREHRLDVERLRLDHVLEGVLERHPQVRVVTIGLGLGLRSDRYRHISWVPLGELAGEVSAFDIGIAPLADLRFNGARSNVKLKEYAAAGVPWLASPIGPYAELGEREGGRLVADDEWPGALDRLIADRRARRKLSKRAVKWAKEQTIGRNVGSWEAALQEAVRLAAPVRA